MSMHVLDVLLAAADELERQEEEEAGGKRKRSHLTEKTKLKSNPSSFYGRVRGTWANDNHRDYNLSSESEHEQVGNDNQKYSTSGRSFHGGSLESRANLSHPESLKVHSRVDLKDISNYPSMGDRSRRQPSKKQTNVFYEKNKREGPLSSQSEREEAADENQNYSTSGLSFQGHVLGLCGNTSHADRTLTFQSKPEQAADENQNHSTSSHVRVRGPPAYASQTDSTQSFQSGRVRAADKRKNYSASGRSFHGRFLGNDSHADRTLTSHLNQEEVADENQNYSTSSHGRVLGPGANASHTDRTQSFQSEHEQLGDNNQNDLTSGRSVHDGSLESRANLSHPDSRKGHSRVYLKDVSNYSSIGDRSRRQSSKKETNVFYESNEREGTLSSQSEREVGADENQNYSTSEWSFQGRVLGFRGTLTSHLNPEEVADENQNYSTSSHGRVLGPGANASHTDRTQSFQSEHEQVGDKNQNYSTSERSFHGGSLESRANFSHPDSRKGHRHVDLKDISNYSSIGDRSRRQSSKKETNVFYDYNEREGTLSSQSEREEAAVENQNFSTSERSFQGRVLGFRGTLTSQSKSEEAVDENQYYSTSNHDRVLGPRANTSHADRTQSSQSGREIAANKNQNYSTSEQSFHGRVLGPRGNTSHADRTQSSQSGREIAANKNQNYSTSDRSFHGRVLGPRGNTSHADRTQSSQSGQEIAADNQNYLVAPRSLHGPFSGPWANLSHPDISNSSTIYDRNSHPSSRNSDVFNDSYKWEEAPSFQRIQTSTPLSNVSFALNLSSDGNYAQGIPDAPLNLVITKTDTLSFAGLDRASVVLDLRAKKSEPRNASPASRIEKKSENHESLPSQLHLPSSSTRRHIVPDDHDHYCKVRKLAVDDDIDQLSQPNRIENNVEVSEPESENDFSDDERDPEWLPDGDASHLNDLSVYEYFEKFKNDILSEHESSTSSAEEDEAVEQTDNEEPQETKSKMQKRNRIRKEKGFSYKRMDGTVVPARRVKPPCECKMRCSDKFPESVRQNLLSKLLALTQSGQNQFLSSHITVINTVRPKVLISRRTRSRIYKLPGMGGPVKVCKQMFMATLDLKDRKVRTLANKLVLGQGIASDDMRKGNCSRKQLSPEHADYIIKHIQSFPAEESHYGREKSSRLYLSSDLNVQRMYELYQDQCGVDNLIPAHYNTYRRAFNSQNLKFRKPKIDTCNTCDMLKIELQVEKDQEKRKEIIGRKEAHHLVAQRIYDEKRNDKKRADQDMSVRTISFDLQKQLATPYLTCGRAFYSRQLYTYNLTIFETQMGSNIPMCYLWDETRAKRGSKEIGSCLWHYLKGLPACVEEVIMYSDRCAGQNNNRTILFIMTYVTELAAADHRKLSICHKFMASGHSHMECDTVHSAIERAKKRSQANIETPHDWNLFISSIRRSPPIIVKDMPQKEFLDFSVLESRYKVPKCTINNDTFKFKEARVFLCSSESPGSVQFKKDVGEEEFQCINLLSSTTVMLKHIQLKPILTKPIVLPTAKLEDLRRLLPFVSQKWYYEAFLKSLAPPGRGRKARVADCDNFDADFDFDYVSD